MLATVVSVLGTATVLSVAPLPWWAKLAIVVGVQGARVGWLLWLARREGAAMSEADEQVW